MLMKILKVVLVLAGFIGGLALIVIGHAHRGAGWLLLMLAGLVLLLVLLYLYNRAYTRADRINRKK